MIPVKGIVLMCLNATTDSVFVWIKVLVYTITSCSQWCLSKQCWLYTINPFEL